jgi:hypothetical protein
MRDPEPVVYLPDLPSPSTPDVEAGPSNHLATAHKFSDRQARGHDADELPAAPQTAPVTQPMPPESVAVSPEPVQETTEQIRSSPGEQPIPTGSGFATSRVIAHTGTTQSAPVKIPTCAFAETRPSSHPLKARASGAFETPSHFAVDRSAARSENVKPTGNAESMNDKTASGDEVAKATDDASSATPGVVAQTKHDNNPPKPIKEELKALPPLPKDGEPESLPVAKPDDGPETPALEKLEQPAKQPETLPAPIESADDKNKPIASTPPPRLVPKPNDCTTAVLGKPRVASTDESVVSPTRFYGSAEYLLWWTKSDHAPVLVTTGPASSNGILGQPGTEVLFGGPGTSLNSDVRQGGRFTLGYWLDPCQQCAVEGVFFFLSNEQTRFLASSDAFPLLARPFFRINTGSEFSEIATRPDLTNGFVKVKAPTELWGAELNARHNWCCGCTYRVDGLAGFRYLNLEDGIHVEENLVAVPTVPMFANDHIVVSDVFDTRNQFYGGQVGVDAELRRGRWFVGLKGKIALGDNHESLNIQGAQTITDPAGNVQVFKGGLLALNSNIGHFTRDRFSVVPEVGITLGYQVTDYMRVTVGYNFLYWSNVLRAGDQIDRVIDETQIPNFGAIHPPAGQNRPAVLFKETDYWAQGLTFGVELRY